MVIVCDVEDDGVKSKARGARHGQSSKGAIPVRKLEAAATVTVNGPLIRYNLPTIPVVAIRAVAFEDTRVAVKRPVGGDACRRAVCPPRPGGGGCLEVEAHFSSAL
jgi:hypothetical protein